MGDVGKLVYEGAKKIAEAAAKGATNTAEMVEELAQRASILTEIAEEAKNSLKNDKPGKLK